MKKLADLVAWKKFIESQGSDLKNAGITRLVIIPHRWLSLFPLHALPGIEPDSTITDDFFISYGPSLGLMIRAKTQKMQAVNSFDTLIDVVDNSTFSKKDVEFTMPQSIKLKDEFLFDELFDENLNLFLDKCYKANIVRFFCHGTFDSRIPLKSCLLSSGSERSITSSELFLKLYLPNCRVVFLNACSTGVKRYSSVDEQTGLEAAFLQSGAEEVISTLWPVRKVLVLEILDMLDNQGYSDIKKSFPEVIRVVKERYKDDLLSWAPFIHSGL